MVFLKGRGAIVAFCALIVLWGSSFAFVKVGVEHSPPLLFAGFRSLLGGAVMLVVAWLWGGRLRFLSSWREYALLALFNVALFMTFQTLAVMLLSSGVAAVLVYLQPILVGFLAWATLGEPLSFYKIGGLALGFTGILVVSLGGLAGGAAEITAAGVGAGAFAALFWAVGTVLFKRAQEKVSPLWSVALPFVAGGAVVTVLGLASESVGAIEPTTGYAVSLAYSSFAGIAAAWLLWFALVAAGEASRVAAYIFAVPVTAVVVGIVFLGEPLRASVVFGGALVAVGVYLVNRSPALKSR